MKFFSIFAFALCVAICYAAAPPKPTGKPEETTYTTKFDNINLDEILSSKRTMKNYMTCLTENKLCSPEGTELRSTYIVAFFFSKFQNLPKNFPPFLENGF